MNDKLSRYLPISLNPDCSFTRLAEIPNTPASPDPNSPSPVLSKDIPLNPHNQNFLRLFLPRHSLRRKATAHHLCPRRRLHPLQPRQPFLPQFLLRNGGVSRRRCSLRQVSASAGTSAPGCLRRYHGRVVLD
ncbi:hypothetical protein CsSME_00029082 [Camellia sinensis var. sinensis]